MDYLIGTNGNDLGIYEASSPEDALVLMLSDAGYDPGEFDLAEHRMGWWTAFPTGSEEAQQAKDYAIEPHKCHYQVSEVYVVAQGRDYAGSLVSAIQERLGSEATEADAKAMIDLGKFDCGGTWYTTDWDRAVQTVAADTASRRRRK